MATVSTLMLVTTIASTALTAAGTIAAGQAQAAQGQAAQIQANLQAQMVEQQAQAAREAAEYRAKQIETAALEEHAQAQQEAQALERNKKLALSARRAGDAAGGFTTTDTTGVALAGDIEQYGSLQQQLAMYGGASRRQGLEAEATATRYNAESGLYASALEAQALRYGGSAAASAGSAARNASYLTAGGQTIAGVGNAWTKYRPSGGLLPAKTSTFPVGTG